MKILKFFCILTGIVLVAGPFMAGGQKPTTIFLSVVIGLVLIVLPFLKKIRQLAGLRKAMKNTKDIRTKPYRTVEITPADIGRPSGVNEEDYKYSYTNNGVYRPDTVDLPLPPVGAELTFEEDPENPYDSEAIKAVWEGETVGWLYRKGKREMIRDWIQRGDPYYAEVTSNDPGLVFWIGMDR